MNGTVVYPKTRFCSSIGTSYVNPTWRNLQIKVYLALQLILMLTTYTIQRVSVKVSEFQVCLQISLFQETQGLIDT